MTTWPVTLDDVRAAQARIAPLLPPTPARSYAELDERVGSGIRVVVKHENFQRTERRDIDRETLRRVVAGEL